MSHLAQDNKKRKREKKQRQTPRPQREKKLSRRQLPKREKKQWRIPHLRVWGRFCLGVLVVAVLIICSTLFVDYRTAPIDEEGVLLEASGWTDPVYAYVLSESGDNTVPIYNEALAQDGECGRGTYIEIETWEPFTAEDGSEYYHIFLNGQYGYIACENITDDRADLLQETQVYVRTAVDLLTEPDGLTLGSLVKKGEMLRIIGYDYFQEDGTVHMYEVKCGTEIGWISSNYVVSDYASSLENWTNDSNIYATHVSRGDAYGGGDAADLDYWPHEKGDFSDQGNVMPESCYSLYVSQSDMKPEIIEQYLEMAEGTAINTFVITILEDGQVAYPSAVLEEYGLLDEYTVVNTLDEFRESIQMIQDAGYYTVARINTFKDNVLASAYPEWSISDLNGELMMLSGSYWPSAYSRGVWELRAASAVEAVEFFGFNEIQFDYVRFPDYIINYEDQGTIDLKNTYGESMAQAVQRFLIYVTDILHAHGAYVSADVFGETSNAYVAPYGQYWDAISTVVDVISGMPYPDHYSSYWSNGSYYRPYQHPYETLYDWARRIVTRQSECSSPAIVRTWIQTWNDSDYDYDEDVITREILALYDRGLTEGYMLWYSAGSLHAQDSIGSAIDHDYYALYLEAEQEDMTLSEYLGIDTTD